MAIAHVTESLRLDQDAEASLSAPLPPSDHSDDAQTDLEVLRSLPRQFCIENQETANWLVRRIMFARQYAQHVKEWADREIRRAQREETTLMFLFGRQIETWAKTEIATLNGRRKSVALPAGTVGFRTVAAKLVVDDEMRVIAWAKENLPDAVVVVEKLSKTTINAYSEKTGVIPDEGAHIEPESQKFFIR